MRNLFASLSLYFSTVLLTTAADAQFQLQRLYTASQQPGFILQANDGNFHGTFLDAHSGYIFKMTPAGTVTMLGSAYGMNRELVLGDDGNAYGTINTQPYGGYTNGSIFKVSPDGLVTNVFVFDGTNGARPLGMRKGIDGCFYGIMAETNRFTNPLGAPATNLTTIFQFTTNNTVTKLYSVTNGFKFTGSPVQGPDGNLYGSVFSAGDPLFPPYSSSDRVFIYSLSTNGDFQIIHTQSNAPAAAGDLSIGSDGALYGTIGAGIRPYPMSPLDGTIFRITTNGFYSNLFSFNSTNGSDPQARLLSGSDGYLYGSTFSGGISNHGTLFRISVQGEFSSLVQFTGPNGSSPSSPLIQAADGNLYGTTQSSTPSGFGTIFRLVQPPMVSSLAFSSSTASITWNSFTNAIYRVDYKSALPDPNWTPLIQRVTATDQTITVFDNFATAPQRFYRVALLP